MKTILASIAALTVLATFGFSQSVISNPTAPNINVQSSVNSTSTALGTNAVWTGTWEDVSEHPSLIVAVKSDVSGSYIVQFSPDGSNIDSSLIRYYRSDQIEAPHRFTITRKYMRVVFTNGDTAQSFLRLQVLLGQQEALNAPTDSVIPKDFDSITTRPTHYRTEVALGKRQGSATWNKFGYNEDVDIGTEVVASWGGTFEPMVEPGSTLSIVSTSTNDTNGGAGAQGVVLYGMDTNFEHAVEVVFLNGTTPVVTTSYWMGLTRFAVYVAGSLRGNEGTITATAVTGSAIQGQVPAGEGTSQQLIYWVSKEAKALASNLLLKANKLSGANPIVTFKFWIFSYVSNCKYEVFRYVIDTSVENHLDIGPVDPFVVDEKSVMWVEATTDKADTEVSGRFSLIEHKNPASE